MAPPLEKLNVGNGLAYFKLAEFNNAVLAYNFVRSPYPQIYYVTWEKDVTDNSFNFGHYFCGDDDILNEQQAMRDFCVRSGLLRKCDLLANENLPDLVDIIGRCRENAKSGEEEKTFDKFLKQADEVMNEPKDMVVDKDALISAQEPPIGEPMEL